MQQKRHDGIKPRTWIYMFYSLFFRFINAKTNKVVQRTLRIAFRLIAKAD